MVKEKKHERVNLQWEVPGMGLRKKLILESGIIGVY